MSLCTCEHGLSGAKAPAHGVLPSILPGEAPVLPGTVPLPATLFLNFLLSSWPLQFLFSVSLNVGLVCLS